MRTSTMYPRNHYNRKLNTLFQKCYFSQNYVQYTFFQENYFQEFLLYFLNRTFIFSFGSKKNNVIKLCTAGLYN